MASTTAAITLGSFAASGSTVAMTFMAASFVPPFAAATKAMISNFSSGVSAASTATLSLLVVLFGFPSGDCASKTFLIPRRYSCILASSLEAAILGAMLEISLLFNAT